jgi:hypothetical protein
MKKKEGTDCMHEERGRKEDRCWLNTFNENQKNRKGKKGKKEK